MRERSPGARSLDPGYGCLMYLSGSSLARAVLAIVFAAATISASAADLELTPPPARPSIATPRTRPASAPAEPSVYGFGATDRTCVAWSDGCVTCSRAGADEPQCSNIGIACQPGSIQCTQR